MAAHLAASRAAAAVVVARGGVTACGRVSRSIWELLPQVEPALSEWADFLLQVRANALRPRQACRMLYRYERQMT